LRQGATGQRDELTARRTHGPLTSSPTSISDSAIR
jgi:hypothetical protein